MFTSLVIKCFCSYSTIGSCVTFQNTLYLVFCKNFDKVMKIKKVVVILLPPPPKFENLPYNINTEIFHYTIGLYDI